MALSRQNWITVMQGLLTKDAGQFDNLEVSKDLATFSNSQLVGSGHAAFHRPFCEGLHRAVCTITSQLSTRLAAACQGKASETEPVA